MDSLRFNSALQEPDAELPGLVLKKQILLKLIGGDNFSTFRGLFTRLYPSHSNPEELIHNFLIRLLQSNDVQSLQLLCLGGLPALLEEIAKQYPPEV